MPAFEDSAVGRLARAIAHKRAGEYDAAEKLLQLVIAEEPCNAEAYHQLGLVQGYRIRKMESLTALENAVALKPDSRTYLVDLAKSYAMFGETDKASMIRRRIDNMDATE